ncbi:DUF389 domain-containing protein [Halopseudomonas salegens]|uniref:Uncharacterized hydrophobic domain-containing protein n=1 Tax=Halopseudomonas salegens TaxID=1434072 RepID=A0A1H2F1M7_9GAMM|nr:DUF389 domain-containing protein [Halopseudomonas salegens]SDU01296.1 uncharacterized hydrophobic domain-containing protein [Halopseudomonas salegens]
MTLHTQALVVYPAEQAQHLEAVRRFAEAANIRLYEFTSADFLAEPGRCLDHAQHVIVLSDEEDFSEYVNQAKTLNFSLGIIPLKAKSRLHKWFGIPARTEDAIALAFAEQSTALDVARCNDEVVLGMVMLGETPFLDQRSKTYQNRQASAYEHLIYWLALVWTSLRNLMAIKPFAVSLTTGKDVTIRTAITGMVAIENDINSAAARLINTTLSAQDGKVSTILIAPKSVKEYLSFLLASLFRGEQQVKRLPPTVSYIKSQYLRIDASKPLVYFVDGRRREAASIELHLYPEAVRINVGEIQQVSQPSQRNGKDTMKIDSLPVNQDRLNMIQTHLPLFTRALEDEFKDLFLQLRENAQAHPHYIALMVLSVIVASLGLYLSSAAVIIGAMVLAPLMSPIISLSMALLRGDRALLQRSSLTIALGVGLALLTAALLALIIPINRITPEMSGRLHPNLLDLGVAIASGIAGGYAHARESVIKSLPGVAIAVALVPPLSVAGIGIGWWQWDVFAGAMLLFLTNLVGIALAAALTFLILGFAPLIKAKRGLTISAVLLATVAIPLTFAFVDINQRWQLERDLTDAPLEVHGKLMTMQAPQVSRQGRGVVIQGDLVAEQPILMADLRALRSRLENQWDRPVTLELNTRVRIGGN